MLQFFASLLALLIFLSGPAMKGNAEIWHSPLAAKTPPLKYHYTTAPESSFQNGLCVTDFFAVVLFTKLAS